ncbi:MAG TPA: hypothetical protein DE315_01690, partial [Candidatus Omnitrophica bacterium]|nr:hypothetical protein [Candidatus Omnitrophota bacterium]
MMSRSFSPARRILSLTTAVIFAFSPIIQPVAVFAQGAAPVGLNLPAPGSMVPMSENFTPLYIKGITVNPDDPLKFSFIVNSGDTNLEGEALKEESQKLIKYFLASLTVPEEELWVNLSPYDRANIIPERFGYTEMGRDLLAQDYMLKQITASVMYPESETGGTFWSRIQQKVKEKFGAEDIPVNMFNKIWIVPDKAEVYEINGSAYVVDSHLKVLLEEDYFALKNDVSNSGTVGQDQAQAVSAVSADVVREVLLPEIEKEVNEGKNFANLRQIYNASILATWYKLNLKDSLLGQVYVDKNKVSGVDVADKSDKLKIYEQYVDAFKKGAYELVKKDYDPATQQIITRKYFSGGVSIETTKVFSSPVKNVSLQEYNKMSPSSPVRQKFVQKVESANPDKNFTVKFTLGTVTQPSSAMAAFSSPVQSAFSNALSVAYHANPQVFEDNVNYHLKNVMQEAKISGDIEKMTGDITYLAKNFSGQLKSPDRIADYFSTKGWSQDAVGAVVKNWDQLTVAAVNNVDRDVAVGAAAIRSGDREVVVRDTTGFLRTPQMASEVQEREAAPLAQEIVRVIIENPQAVQSGRLETILRESPALKEAQVRPQAISAAARNF